MQKFLEHCQSLGLSQTVLNGQKLRNGIQAGLDDCSLFFICGYDFVFHPNDRKFWGIEHLFVQQNAPYALNLGPKFRPLFRGALEAHDARAQRRLAETGHMLQTRRPVAPTTGYGVRFMGAANYNLQTNALELLVTDANGMDYDSGLKSVMPNLKAAFAKPSPNLSFHTQEVLSEMRATVQPYWGSDTWRLGL